MQDYERDNMEPIEKKSDETVLNPETDNQEQNVYSQEDISDQNTQIPASETAVNEAPVDYSVAAGQRE